MNDIDAWRSEILELSDLPQDHDPSRPDDAEQRFNRFVELVGVVQGDEVDEVFLTLMQTSKINRTTVRTRASSVRCTDSNRVVGAA